MVATNGWRLKTTTKQLGKNRGILKPSWAFIETKMDIHTHFIAVGIPSSVPSYLPQDSMRKVGWVSKFSIFINQRALFLIQHYYHYAHSDLAIKRASISNWSILHFKERSFYYLFDLCAIWTTPTFLDLKGQVVQCCHFSQYLISF